MDVKIGDRVGALAFKHGDNVGLLGFGVYEGDFVPPATINPALNLGYPNPRILLDDGQIVWGMECWWGAEVDIKSAIKGKNVTHISIDSFRQRPNAA